LNVYFDIIFLIISVYENILGIGLKNQQTSADNQHQEFNIQPEDFPALPRPQSVNNKSNILFSLNEI
jgi:hypothetical protein